MILICRFRRSLATAQTNDSPFGLRETVPRGGKLCRSRAFTRIGLWSYYFWAAVCRGATRRRATVIPIPFEPKQESICLAPKAQHLAPAWGSAPGFLQPQHNVSAEGAIHFCLG